MITSNSVLDFLQPELDNMIKEAKETALKNVKEKLILNFESILYEQAMNQLSSRPLAKEVQVTEPFQYRSSQAISGAHKKVYLYGITEVAADHFVSQGNFDGIADGTKVFTLIHKNLLAVISEVSPEDFNEGKIPELAEKREWLEDKTERHQKVISLLMGKYAVIPMGFCSLYPSQDQLRIFLEENYHDLIEQLTNIHNKTEWGLKLYLNEELFKQFLQEKDESINNLMNEMSLNQTGKGYLPKKRLANRIEKKAFDIAEEVHRRLCRFSAGAILNKLPPKEVGGKGERMILNGAYLLEKNKEDNFFETVKWLEETEGPRGFVFEITGPWPCYNFCRVSSTGT
ncbi:GvpL/GvpF family gas vesicle protein [Candidatus Formimonas warabiya]|uniref:GvpL/GvpF family gas vesicle protein n=1 Tax=Formimonas warabiya TaxID=1761012 RepID=A0A3G1KWY4_FORW1|nr:GvpL/GvpF family gas vesicle protein [Candidatus Formimonas warabiya]ATW26907.1 hypothetical protein DCMF_21000 [Candidatus Formimonas warabiya]